MRHTRLLVNCSAFFIISHIHLHLHLKTEAYTRIKELVLSVVYIKVTRMEETAIQVPGLVYLMPFYGLLQSVVYKYIVCNTIAISEFIQ